MLVYRITKSEERAVDLSGTGAFLAGGRWNSEGVYMLYTSENSSLAYLESLAHLDEHEEPGHLFITQIELDDKLLYKLPEADYPTFWEEPDNQVTQSFSDNWIKDEKYLGLIVKSALNPTERNILLNPKIRNFENLVKIISVTPITIDPRLRRQQKSF